MYSMFINIYGISNYQTYNNASPMFMSLEICLPQKKKERKKAIPTCSRGLNTQ